MSKKLKQFIANMCIIVKNISIEIYYFIDIIKHYHKFLHQVYSIIIIEIPGI